MAVGPSTTIILPPVLAFDSATASTVTLNLTSIPAGADAVTVYYRAEGLAKWVPVDPERTATGTFVVSSLAEGATYWFIAIPQEAAGEIGPASIPLQVTLSGAANPFGLEELIDLVVSVLKAAVWPGSANSVFGESVFPASGESIAAAVISQMVMPSALVYELGHGGQVVDEEPLFGIQRVGVTIYNSVPGDSFGSNVLKGAHRASEQVSQGAGLYDLHSVALRELRKRLRDANLPVRLIGVMQSGNSSTDFESSKRIGSKSYTLSFVLKEE